MPTKLGQNFLRDQSVLDRIIKSANLSGDDLVLEVGPGEGVLTERLVEYAKKVIAIEIDNNLASRLDSRFHGNDNIVLINADILDINLPELIENYFFCCHSERSVAEPKNLLKNNTSNNSEQILRLRSDDYIETPLRMTKSYKVVANIPYYITSPIIRLFLETKYPPTEMLLMVQKEVAERICAKAGKMSILALSVQYYASAELLFTVPAEAFSPVPEVDSAVIRITRHERPAYAKASAGEVRNKDEAKKFFRVVKAGFSAKRKTLANNLSSSLKLEKSSVEEKLKQNGISQNQRAQELSLEDWKKLAELL
jgi:16S rRNA (adenine1518-N6/adenine1519-N6)-dimethyltransferase